MKFLWVSFQKHLSYQQFYLQLLSSFTYSSSEITGMSGFVVSSTLNPSFQLYVNTNTILFIVFQAKKQWEYNGIFGTFLVVICKMTNLTSNITPTLLCSSVNQQIICVCPVWQRFILSLNQSLWVSFLEELSWMKQKYEIEEEDMQTSILYFAAISLVAQVKTERRWSLRARGKWH